MMFLLRCPKCGNKMKYQTLTDSIKDKSKRCVYCGKTYKISSNIIKKL